MLPPHSYWPRWTGQAPDDGEDLELPYRLLNHHGFEVRRIDTFGRP